MIRRPAVAGTFYPGTKDILEKELENNIKVRVPQKQVLGLVSPHAGYIYSGSCAGKGFAAVEIPGTVIILGVNHRGFGHPFAVDGNMAWQTPLGDTLIDDEIRTTLVQGSGVFEIDSVAGRSEHSLEVQVPFIQYMNPQAKILPITISSMELDEMMAAGAELGRLISSRKGVLMIASTDMSHYISAKNAEKQDRKAIDQFLALDPKGLFRTVVSERISMCGVSPTVIMLAAALEAGAGKAEEIEYTHSGIVSGDYDQVVGYFSGIVY